LTPIRIEITNSESAFISAFKKLARRNFGANIQYYPRKNALPLYVLYSKVITSIFHSLGIPYGYKSTDKPLRRFIVEKLPTDYLASFLRGWFDGDGGVVKRKDTGEFWLHFTTGIRENAEALKHSLWRLGITSRVRKRSYYYQVIVYGRSNIKNFLKKIGTNIPQKELKMEEAINIREYEDRIPGVGRLIRRERKKLGISIEKMSSIAPHSSLSEYERGKAIPRSILKKLIQFFEKEGATCHHLKRLVNSNLKWEKIKRKIPSETEDWVYDLTVTSGYEPNFIAEHFILHNCICYFGGDPSPQMPHALRTSEIALEKAREQGRILRICFETNGYMIGAFADRAAELSFESGGTVKFDIKTFNETLNQVLCGVSNKPTLDGFRRIGEKFFHDRLEPPVLTASTLLIPGYIDAEEIGQIADFLAGIDPKIPYTLLAFYPQYVMHDLPPTSRQLALECFEAAKKAGLERIKLGNVHLLS
jgi:pyruvate-formate lyase-activating enzyme